MRAWRISKAVHIRDLQGTGSKLYGGRWNSKGVPVVYLGATLSLSAQEYFVHLDGEDIPKDLACIAVDIPDEVFARRVKKTVGDLPSGWRDHPPGTKTQSFGDAWVKSGASLVLELPSVVIPREVNYLLNVEHPDMRSVKAVQQEPFEFDPRLWK